MNGRDSGSERYLTQVARTNYSSLIDTWHAAGHTEHARACARLAVAQGVWTHPLQRDRDHLADLTADPLPDPSRFWFVDHLEQRFPEIQAEVRGVLAAPGNPVQPTVEDDWLLQAGSWRQAYLFRDGRWQEETCRHLPVTRAILAEIPEVTTFSPGVILVSRLTPGTRIMPHCGSTNAVLRIHLPITVPSGAWIRVADQTLTWQEGRCLIFDDSFEHEVGHEGTEDRVVLILDIAHPDLDPRHRERLLANRPSPEERILAFLRQRGIAQVSLRDGDVLLTPEPAMADLADRYLTSAGLAGAELDGDQVHWRPAPEPG
ncbi:aspartyl/asparaginyl beta-hydroxylase domain-containing protein [Micromonospora craterilacus]|uniref:Aspartyl/asparaginyl beta-hydroxylase domain-containing protein n=1 Tax=Micromonospora craterilacus TaxID=1655439 RepID=A0A2W2ELL7_9ACTN|nr:aspartyl/asparaginyl beta-hydroxylase domain-containing protein [Micromonospora craterilacus]PZG13298.1 aspartyl/asparaginyl beta-hydroxylase domain-containing protein [Micromonospora craterilacus]